VGYEVLILAPATGARRVLVGGWLQANGRATHRPVDVQERPDGSLFISDDFGGTIFRLTYE
jgi:glucose/arabinose dehydrogenase